MARSDRGGEQAVDRADAQEAAELAQQVVETVKDKLSDPTRKDG